MQRELAFCKQRLGDLETEIGGDVVLTENTKRKKEEPDISWLAKNCK